MIGLCDIPTISEADVVETLNTFETQKLKDGEMDAIYNFASELTGRSIDFLWNQTETGKKASCKST